MIYALITIAVLIGILLALRLRLRLEFSSERKLLFLGLGRSGPEYDFRTKRGVLRLFGREFRQFRLGRSKSITETIKSRLESRRAKQAEESEEAGPETTKPKKRTRSFRDIAAIGPECLRALGRYTIGLLQTAMVEQAEAEIEAGFEQPHLTGQLFGYYQAVLGAVPALGRVQYTPVWSGRAFSGSANLRIAWPVYRLAWETTLLLFRLPVMKIVKLAIGSKEGAQDG